MLQKYIKLLNTRKIFRFCCIYNIFFFFFDEQKKSISLRFFLEDPLNDFLETRYHPIFRYKFLGRNHPFSLHPHTRGM